MVLIEGIGDEVTLVCGAFLILFITAVAWLSTRVSDRPLLNIVVLDRNGFQGLIQRLRNSAYTILGPDGQPMNDAAINRLTDNNSNDAANTDSSTNAPASIEDTASGQTGSEPGLVTEGQTTVSDSNVESTSNITSNVSTDISPAVTESTLSSSASAGQSGLVQGQSDITQGQSDPSPSSSTLSETEIRQRRVAFFTNIDISAAETSPSISSATDLIGDNSNNAATSNSNTPIQQQTESQSNESVTEPSPAAPQSGLLTIRLKYLDERQREVQASPSDTIGEFKRRYFSREMAENLVVRFIYNGQELRQDSSTLQSYNVRDSSVIHCLFSQPQHPLGGAAANQHQGELDVGRFMFPMFALILALVWYGRFTYRNYFNAMSTFALVGISFLFIVALMAAWRTHDVREHHD